jgi:hypothetical protein
MAPASCSVAAALSSAPYVAPSSPLEAASPDVRDDAWCGSLQATQTTSSEQDQEQREPIIANTSGRRSILPSQPAPGNPRAATHPGPYWQSLPRAAIGDPPDTTLLGVSRTTRKATRHPARARVECQARPQTGTNTLSKCQCARGEWDGGGIRRGRPALATVALEREVPPQRITSAARAGSQPRPTRPASR